MDSGTRCKSRQDVDADGVQQLEALLAEYTDAVRFGKSDSTGPLLGKLLRDHAQPVISTVTRQKLFSGSFRGQTYQAHDEEDVRSTAALQLILRLRKAASSGTSIENFAAYVARITLNCCNQLLRRKYPQHTRLKNRIRYLMRHDPQFALWESDGEHWLCGFAAWKDATASVTRQVFEPLNLDELNRTSLRGRNIGRMNPAELVRVLLKWRGCPIVLDELVRALASLYGVRDVDTTARHRDENDMSDGDMLAAASADAITLLDAHSSLERLWTEVCSLPRPQRVALLLNLRDMQRRDALTLLPLTGIASLREIASVLEIAPQTFAEIWSTLPLDDLSIAALLRVSRQQVINLRKSARERLARRMAPWRETEENG